ncbi:hypothetical protein JW960_11240 [candidate division KSB1 bacterium]|nr:hypothetical protein [candidate division KSB1 bacterium]
MTLEIYSEFLKSINKKVITNDNCIWVQLSSRQFYQCFPVHIPVRPDKEQLSGVFRNGPALGVKYTTDDPTIGGMMSFVYTCTKSDYDIQKLSSNNRSKVRRGIKQCRIEQITNVDYLTEAGWQLNKETMERQGRGLKAKYLEWQQVANCVGKFDGLEVWGAWVDDDLASFVLLFIVDNCANLLTFRSSNQYLRFYPNNALIYTVITRLFERDNVDIVSFGEESINYLEGLDNFKTGIGFNKEPVYQKIQLNPLIAWLHNGMSSKLIQVMAARYPQKSFWQKVERFDKFLH